MPTDTRLNFKCQRDILIELLSVIFFTCLVIQCHCSSLALTNIKWCENRQKYKHLLHLQDVIAITQKLHRI